MQMNSESTLDSPEVTTYTDQIDKCGFCNLKAVTLSTGAPRTELLKMLPPMIGAATKHRMEKEFQNDAKLFQYGSKEGNWDFRVSLAKFLSEEYGDPVKCQNIFLTAGASFGLWLILSALFKPGTIVFVEDPSYFNGLSILNDAQVTLVPIKTDSGGIIVEDLQNKLVEYFSSKPAPCIPPVRAMIYLIPTFHNPTGVVLLEERCRRLIHLTRKYGITIVCDDVYNLLHYEDSTHGPKRLFAFDNEEDPDYTGTIISNGSFSKFLAPGLRIGWLEAPTWVVEELCVFGPIGSGGGVNTYTSGLITSMLELGILKNHLNIIRESFKHNMNTIVELLINELPPTCTLKSPGIGGYFLWIELPAEIDAAEFNLFCSDNYNISFLPGQKTSLTKSYSNYIRICISFNPVEVLVPAVRQLCRAISIYQEKLNTL